MTINKPQKRDLTKGPIIPHIVRMALPMTIGIGSIISFSLVDSYFIGQLGTDELAAMGYIYPVSTIFINIIFGLAIAMSASVSKRIGAGAMDEVRQVVTIGLAIVFLLALGLASIGYVTIDPIFRAMGAGDTIMPHIHEYMPMWYVSAVFVAIPIVANSAIRGTGDAFWPGVIMVMVALINGVLDPIFIFGMFGLPSLGMFGAAFASFIANVIATCTALFIIIYREKLFSLFAVVCGAVWKKSSKALLVIAIPVSLSSLIAPIVSYLYTMILSDISDEAVAGFGVVMRFEAFALIPIMAVAGGMAPLIGQNYGAGLYDRVHEALNKALKFSGLYGLGSAVVLLTLSSFAGTIFSDDEDVRSFVTMYLLYVPLSYIALNIFVVTTSSMNAMGKAKKALLLNILKSFVIGVPGVWVLSDVYVLDGFFTGIVITNIFACICALFCMKSLYCKDKANRLQ